MSSGRAAASGWIRVAAGLRLVASAASSQSSQQLGDITTSVAQHAAEVLANAHTATQAAAATTMQQHRTPTSTINEVENNMMKQQQSHRNPVHSEPVVFKADKQHHESSTGVHMQEEPETSLSQLNVSVSHKAPPGTPSIKDNEEPKLNGFKDINGSTPTLNGSDETYEKRLQEGRAVPSTRIGRAMGFASLGFGLALGTAAEATSRLLQGSSSKDSLIVTDANADRLSASLCRMRGAALKLGQMLSIQDESMLPPALSRALNQVRQGADAMPQHQLESQLQAELGRERRNLLQTFDDLPFAAASIGQVHLGTIKCDNDEKKKIVLKVQYPGVADSIDSDLNNLQMLISMTGLAPPGLFMENIIRVGRTELKQECDYVREAQNQTRFQELVEGDPILSQERFVVPRVIPELSTRQILTSEYAPGGTIDKVSHLDQDERNRIALNIMRLTMQELFVWRFMQTDPNWGNFLYDVGTGTTYLIDFGAAREYSKHFVDGYLRIVWAAANCDGDTIMDQSHEMGFLIGEENDIMMEAHKASGFTVGEPFRYSEPFDFRGSNISSRLSRETSVFLQHRLTPPPEEIYTLHRKLAGAYMLCIKLGAVINCRELLEDIVVNHTFDDKAPPSIESNVLQSASLQQA